MWHLLARKSPYIYLYLNAVPSSGVDVRVDHRLEYSDHSRPPKIRLGNIEQLNGLCELGCLSLFVSLAHGKQRRVKEETFTSDTLGVA
jgi:hypothetical protein